MSEQNRQVLLDCVWIRKYPPIQALENQLSTRVCDNMPGIIDIAIPQRLYPGDGAAGKKKRDYAAGRARQ